MKETKQLIKEALFHQEKSKKSLAEFIGMKSSALSLFLNTEGQKLPLKYVRKVRIFLNITDEEMNRALMRDYSDLVSQYINTQED